MVEQYGDEKRASLFLWCEIKKGSKILYIGEETDAFISPYVNINEVICCSQNVFQNHEWLEEYKHYFDYILSIEDLEKIKSPIEILCIWKKLLNSDGKMFLALNNRLGIRYFCGDRDPYTNRNFDGIEDYKNFYAKSQDEFIGRMYDQSAIREMLFESGWNSSQIHFYSVFSDLNNPALIYSEKYIPKEVVAARVFPTYNHPDTVFIEEEGIYEGLIRNNMFHQMANAYIIECSVEQNLLDVLHVTNSIERGKCDALLTIIHESGIVEKKAIYPEAIQRLEEIHINSKELKKHGIAVVEGEICDDSYVMTYVNAKVGQVYLQELMQKDKELFLEKLDQFRDNILRSSSAKISDAEDGKGVILEKGYIDMIPLNSFYKDEAFVFYDQEFSRDDCPANFIIYRMVVSIYSGNLSLEKYVSMQELFERYQLVPYLSEWAKLATDFIKDLRRQKKLQSFHVGCQRDYEIVQINRRKINYTEDEYNKIFRDILKDLDGKKIILFGSGVYAQRFMTLFGKDVVIECIIDNNNKNWGKEIAGIKVESPDILKNLPTDKYRVIICIKKYLSVLKQLQKIGNLDFGVFDPSCTYKTYNIKFEKEQKTTNNELKKKYKVGYVAGVFDMFHVGHLNLLRKAKEQCEYLIVGIVPDEDVYRSKNKYPIISCEDRVEIVNSCKYVDKAEALPIGCGGIRDAYKRYQFDVQFSGDDHGSDMDWMMEKQYLQKKGADIVFFPYTEKISSTLLREKRSN